MSDDRTYRKYLWVMQMEQESRKTKAGLDISKLDNFLFYFKGRLLGLSSALQPVVG
jgi:hypothetical protein